MNTVAKEFSGMSVLTIKNNIGPEQVKSDFDLALDYFFFF